ncbi:MAG: hypothetical protein HY200_10345 [Nitrospirae bacterium]|nr:hypothetical protein [Nitrospirota bacterium]MBI3595343.1 hypothetical protein [Nitrospirota bacterium]
MVKRIKRKIKITPHTRHLISLAMVISPQFGPSRESPFLQTSFDPPELLADFFHQHFRVELFPADRFLSFEEYRKWVASTKPVEFLKTEMKKGYLHFEAVPETSLRENALECLFLPILGAATDADWAEQLEEWTEGFSELQGTVFRHLIEPVLGIVPGVDKCFYLGPAPVKGINQVIFYLHGRVSDDCRLNQWPVPSLFPILDFKIIEKLPLKYPISF